MDLEQFVDKTKTAVQNYYGELVTVIISRVTKNNGVVLDGLTILAQEKNVSPTIYLNSFHEQYKGGKQFSEIVKEILEVYENNKLTGLMSMDFFLDYEQVKSKIAYKLINYEKNLTLLQNTPHIPYLDLAIVFYCMVSNDIFGNGTILIQNSHLDLWKIEREELYENAKENTPRLLRYELKSMNEMIQELCLTNLEEIAEAEEIQMFVLSNQSRLHGATCILYQDILKDFANEVKKDVYILPSSIHEVILVPAKKGENERQLNTMVREVNETQVEEEEILSNCIYFYSRNKEEISKIQE